MTRSETGHYRHGDVSNVMIETIYLKCRFIRMGRVPACGAETA